MFRIFIIYQHFYFYFIEKYSLERKRETVRVINVLLVHNICFTLSHLTLAAECASIRIETRRSNVCGLSFILSKTTKNGEKHGVPVSNLGRARVRGP